MSTQVPVPLPLVLVAHRERDNVDLLKGLLEHEGFTVLSAYTGRAALQYAHQHHPMLLLLDQNLPLLDGLELCRILRRDSDDLAIFLLTDHQDEFGKLLAFSAGADDCLALPIHPRELLARAKAVLRRTHVQGQQPQPVLRCGALELDPDQRQVQAAGKVIALTGLEYELLSLLMRAPGRVFSREQLLELLPGFGRSSPLDRAVDIHVSNLRRKLREVLLDAMPIESVRGVGYRLSVSASSPLPETSAPAADLGKQLALAAFDRAPTPLLVLDRDRTVVLYNEAAGQLCGWPADQVVGQAKCYSLLCCHNSDGTLLCNERCALHVGALSRLNDQVAYYSITLKDGREIPIQAHYSNLGTFGDGGYTLLTIGQRI
jgi:DNA-binding response OmpR family regulator